MALLVFVFIAWLIVCVFSLIPKKFGVRENMVIFFCLTIMVLSFYTVLALNLKLINYSKEPGMMIIFWLHRDIIIPLSLTVFANLLISYQGKTLVVFVISIITFCVLLLSELSTLWFGIKTYSGWNQYYMGISFALLMLISLVITKIISKLPEGKP